MTCPHAVPFGGTVPAVNSLTHGARICRGCLERGEAWPAMLDDGVCDVCDHQASTFRESTTALGADIVVGNICPACARFCERAADRRAAA